MARRPRKAGAAREAPALAFSEVVCMKLAEALLERKAIKERIRELQERAKRDARVQEGDRPAEDPAALMAEVESLAARLERLIVAINRANSAVRLPDGRTLMEAIARRDVLSLLHQAAKGLADAAAPGRDGWRMTRDEIRTVATVDAAEWRAKADRVCQRVPGAGRGHPGRELAGRAAGGVEAPKA